jgi:hypothetical protein
VAAFPSTAFFFCAAAAMFSAVQPAQAQAPAPEPAKAPPAASAEPGKAEAKADDVKTDASKPAEGTEAAKTAEAAAAAAAAAAVATPPVSGSVELGVSQERSQFNQIRIGDSPVILVPGDHVRRNEPFRHFAVGVNGNVPSKVVGALNLVADLNYDSHIGFQSSDVDTVFAQGDAGVQYGFGKNILGAKAVLERWQVGGEEFRRVKGGSFDLVSAISDEFSTYLLAQFNTYRHPGDQSILDADYRALTGNVRWGTKDPWSSAYTLQGTYSRELNKGNDPTLDVDAVMIRAAWDAKPREGWYLSASTIQQRSSFGAVDPLFGLRRVDRYSGYDISLAHDLTKSLTARLELGYARYRSSVTAFDNDWSSVALAVIWRF